MEFSAGQIAEMLGGELVGNAEQKVNALSKIEEGKSESLSFLSNPKYTEYIYSTKASVVIVANTFVPEKNLPKTLTLIKVDDAYACFAKLLDAYQQLKHSKTGVENGAFVAESAKLGEDVYVGGQTYISDQAEIANAVKIYHQCIIGERVKIGSGTLIHAGVKIMADSVIGDDCVIQPGSIIGGDGFGFAPNSEGNYAKVPQIGNVILEDHVEIGAGTTIDRATLGSTIIRKGAKIDNLIQIAHNVEIGENTVIAAQTGIAGSTKIGKNCMIGGQVGIVGHLHIPDGTKIAAQSGVGHSLKEENQIIQGSPAFGIGDYKRSYVGFRKLPEIQKEINEIKKQLKSE
jgi:UDP-3-O-[3-hydroxymyristoyl] glucosamine N-acyltransferase